MARRNQPDQDRSPLPFCIALGVLILATAVLVSFLFPGPAGSQTFSPDQTGTFLVTDYANYPDTLQTGTGPGCDGGGIFEPSYSLNGGPPAANPRLLPEFAAGDEITLSWTSTTDQCKGAPVVLDIKIAQVPTFDPSLDQTAFVPYSEVTATGGPQSISFTMPPLIGEGKGCNFQFDAIVGRPLAIVGPSGSDYSSSVRGDDKRTMIVGYDGYRNGAYATCETEQTTTTTAPTTTTSSTIPETTTTSTPVSSTVPAVTEDTTPTCAPVQEEQSLSPAAAACVLSGDTTVETSGEDAPASGVLPASTQRELAKTGAQPYTPAAAAVGLLLVLVGAGLVIRRNVKDGQP